MTQRERAVYFRQLHSRRPLVLLNAWDAATARVIEAAGASAIATTSAGISWSFGRRDGQTLHREEMLRVIQSIAETVHVPVNADVESGYGQGTPADVSETVRLLVAMGVAGLNLEDSPGQDGEALLPPHAQAERLRAAREAALAQGGDLVINARTDVYLFQVGEPEGRLEAVVERARIYRAAGADCIFVPGVTDAEIIAQLVKAIDAPLNVMVAPGAPGVQELARLGVARVSVGPAIAQAALGAVQRAARELLECGTYGSLGAALPFGEISGLLTARSATA
jgi:2-methylisocitrate lyase-like PEP mutase family enzyme